MSDRFSARMVVCVVFRTDQASKFRPYQCFDMAVVLDQVIRQSGSSCEHKYFRDTLLSLWNVEITIDDWKYLMTLTVACATNCKEFLEALHLIPTREAVIEHNINCL